MYSKASKCSKEISEMLADQGNKWVSNPLGSTHFGGLWESAVKSTKYHLKSVMGLSVITFEEFYTLLKQVEACLKSWPLISLKDDISGLNVLSRSHFVTSSPSYIFPDYDYSNFKIFLLGKWKSMQKLCKIGGNSGLEVIWNLFK